MFFKITYVIAELCGPPLVRDYPLIFANDQQVEVSKLKYKWEGEFDNLSYFSNENIKAWTVDYVYINSNTSIIINEVWEEVLEIKNEMFKMKIKQEITIPTLQDFITEWLEKLLVAIVETN